MDFKTALNNYDIILQNGPLGTRLKYDFGYEASFDLSHSEKEKHALMALYMEDLKQAQQYNLPIILNTASYRLSKNHLENAGICTHEAFVLSNKACIALVRDIKKQNNTVESRIFVGGALGSMHDAYSNTTMPSSEEAYRYHLEQITVFKQERVDFVNAVTLPSITEALGIAKAADASEIHYTIGFILNNKGKLLDRNALEDAINTIDAATCNKPLGYTITCTHPNTISNLSKSTKKYSRLIGIQANGSSLPFNELANMKRPMADAPQKFARAVIALKKQLSLTMIGGCCGTTSKHLESIAKYYRDTEKL